MAYTAWSVVFGEQPTAAKWNQLGENDAGFKDGTNIDAGAITNTHLASGISSAKLSNPYKFDAYRSGATNSGNNVFAKVNLNAKNFDTGNNFDTATNFRFVAPIAGFYFFNGHASAGTSNSGIVAAIYVNGAENKRGTKTQAAGIWGSVVTGLIQLAAGDYVELYVWGNTTTALEIGNSPQSARLSGFLVSAT